MISGQSRYQRDRLTWAAFGALFAFGFLNAALGPALPYLRAEENLSYVTGALHQVAFAVGGGSAGLLAAWRPEALPRAWVIGGGLTGAAVAGLGLGFGRTPAVTLGAALLVSLLGTSALIRLWAVLADVHGSHRTRAMTEGEVAVSLAGIVTALAVGGLAATALTWRAAFVLGGVVTVATALAVVGAKVPPPAPARTPDEPGRRGTARVPASLVIVFAVVGVEFTLSFWLASYLNEDIGVARSSAAALVSVLYAAHLGGRLLTSWVAGRGFSAEHLLGAALLICLAGTPVLLTATTASVAIVGIVVVGAATGALFPLTSSIHVGATSRNADHALGQVLAVAALGQIAGPLCAGVLASDAAVAGDGGLRLGLCVVPVLVLVAGAALARHRVTAG